MEPKICAPIDVPVYVPFCEPLAILQFALNEAINRQTLRRAGRGFAFAISRANVGEGGDRSKATKEQSAPAQTGEGCIASGKTHQPANSRERAVAAAMASLMSRMRPFGRISTASAAAVVPPGEVTFWRNVAASWRD